MTTPNIENIIKSLVVNAGVMEMGEKIAWGSDTALMRQAAAALQTQAERIEDLEAEINIRASYGDEQTDFAISLAAERDALRAQLAEIAASEPVGAIYTIAGVQHCTITETMGDTDLFTRPIPAQIIGLQDVHDAVTADPTLAESNAEFDESQFKSVEDLIAHLNKLNSYRDRTLEALETCSYGDYSAKHVVDPSFDGDAVEAAIESLKAALAQHREQQPVCHGCGIPAGDVHMSTCKSGKWPSRVSNGDTAAPAPQAQEPHVWMIQGSHGTWKGEHAEMDAKAEAKRCGGTCYAYPLYTQPAQMRILTDEQIKYMWAQYCSYPGGILDFARAIREAK